MKQHSWHPQFHSTLTCSATAKQKLAFRYFFHGSFRKISYSPSSSMTTCATYGWLWICVGCNGAAWVLPAPCATSVPCHSLTQHQLLYCRKRSWRGTGAYGEPWYPSFKTKSFWKKHCFMCTEETLLPANTHTSFPGTHSLRISNRSRKLI